MTTARAGGPMPAQAMTASTRGAAQAADPGDGADFAALLFALGSMPAVEGDGLADTTGAAEGADGRLPADDAMPPAENAALPPDLAAVASLPVPPQPIAQAPWPAGAASAREAPIGATAGAGPRAAGDAAASGRASAPRDSAAADVALQAGGPGTPDGAAALLPRAVAEADRPARPAAAETDRPAAPPHEKAGEPAPWHAGWSARLLATDRPVDGPASSRRTSPDAAVDGPRGPASMPAVPARDGSPADPVPQPPQQAEPRGAHGGPAEALPPPGHAGASDVRDATPATGTLPAGAAGGVGSAHGALPPAPAMPAPMPGDPVAASIDVPFASPEFGPAIGAQVSVLVQGGVQQAQLRLNPPEMGPISVQIELGDGAQAVVHFAAEVAATRSAIEASLPDLAGALRDAGLTLAGGGVSEHPRGHAQPRDAGGTPARPARDGAAGDDAARDGAASIAMPARRGVVDLIA